MEISNQHQLHINTTCIHIIRCHGIGSLILLIYINQILPVDWTLENSPAKFGRYVRPAQKGSYKYRKIYLCNIIYKSYNKEIKYEKLSVVYSMQPTLDVVGSRSPENLSQYPKNIGNHFPSANPHSLVFFRVQYSMFNIEVR